MRALSLSQPRERERPVERARELVDAHFSAVFRALRRLGVPDSMVDDAAQQVFVVAVRRLDEIDPPRARSYLLGIALRVAANARRSLARRREVLVDDLETTGVATTGTPHDQLEEQQARRFLGEILDAMSDELREAFVLFELEELTAAEVAATLEVPVGTVASRVRRAREQIRAAIAQRGAT